MSEKIKNVNAENLTTFANCVKKTINDTINGLDYDANYLYTNLSGSQGFVRSVGQTDGKIAVKFDKELLGLEKFKVTSGAFGEMSFMSSSTNPPTIKLNVDSSGGSYNPNQILINRDAVDIKSQYTSFGTLSNIKNAVTSNSSEIALKVVTDKRNFSSIYNEASISLLTNDSESSITMDAGKINMNGVVEINNTPEITSTSKQVVRGQDLYNAMQTQSGSLPCMLKRSNEIGEHNAYNIMTWLAKEGKFPCTAEIYIHPEDLFYQKAGGAVPSCDVDYSPADKTIYAYSKYALRFYGIWETDFLTTYEHINDDVFNPPSDRTAFLNSMAQVPITYLEGKWEFLTNLKVKFDSQNVELGSNAYVKPNYTLKENGMVKLDFEFYINVDGSVMSDLHAYGDYANIYIGDSSIDPIGRILVTKYDSVIENRVWYLDQVVAKIEFTGANSMEFNDSDEGFGYEAVTGTLNLNAF